MNFRVDYKIKTRNKRLHCAHLTQLRFSDVYSHFKSESKSTGLPLWLDKAPTKNLPGDVVTGNAVFKNTTLLVLKKIKTEISFSCVVEIEVKLGNAQGFAAG